MNTKFFKYIFIVLLAFFLACNSFAIAETVEISHLSNRVSIAEPPWNNFNPSSLNRVGVVVNDPEVYWSTSHFQFVAWLPKSNFDNADTVAPFSAKDCEVRYETASGVIVGYADVSITTTTNYCTVIVDFKGMNLTAYSSQTLLWVEGLMDSQLDPKYYTSSLNWSPELENCFLEVCDDYNHFPNQPVPAFNSAGDVEGYHYVSYPSKFYHTLQYNYNESYQYNQLDIIKKDTYGVYSSNCTVSILDSDYNLIQEITNQTEAGWDSENISLKLFDSYIEYIQGELLEIKIDPFAFPGFVFTEHFTFTPPPPDGDGILNTLTGNIIDAKTNAIIPLNLINLTSITGYGGSYSTLSTEAGAYSITNIIDDIYYIQANRSGYENYIFQKNITIDMEHTIYMVKNITIDSGKAGIYGVITNIYNASAVNNVYVRLYNDTYQKITYTNEQGYYEILNFLPGNYSFQAIEPNYYPFETNLNFSTDELKYYPFEITSFTIPEEEEEPLDPSLDVVDNLFNAFSFLGLNEEFIGYIVALAIILTMMATVGQHGAVPAIFAGFLGFCICIAMGLLPIYLLTIVIIIAVAMIIFKNQKEG